MGHLSGLALIDTFPIGKAFGLGVPGPHDPWFYAVVAIVDFEKLHFVDDVWEHGSERIIIQSHEGRETVLDLDATFQSEPFGLAQLLVQMANLKFEVDAVTKQGPPCA